MEWNMHTLYGTTGSYSSTNPGERRLQMRLVRSAACTERPSSCCLCVAFQIKGKPQHGHCSQLPQRVILSVKRGSVDLLVCLLVALNWRFDPTLTVNPATK